MRFPSVRSAADEARRALARFPTTLACGAASAFLGWIVVAGGPHLRGWMSALAATTLGIPLFFAIEALRERRRGEPSGGDVLVVALQLLGAFALIGFGLASTGWTEATQWRRYAQFSVGFHLLVSFLPWIGRREPNGFWQYNRALFLGFLRAALDSVVLFAGLAGALATLNPLFGVEVPGVVFARLWLVIAFVFNTWRFVALVPPDLAALESDDRYPNGLRTFTQFILTPLVAVHLGILTAYFARVLATQVWPSNLIVYLVSAAAGVGILSLLLVHPIRNVEGQRWIGLYSRGFYLALVPSVGMLLAAIAKRIGQHGVTEDRYFIVVLSSWLALVTLLYLARRNADIRWIPISLAVLAFLTSFGPWGAFTVSRRDQVARVRSWLDGHGVPRGRYTTPASPVSLAARRELSSRLTYLFEAHGRSAVDQAFGAPVPRLGPTPGGSNPENARLEAQEAMRGIGLLYVDSWGSGRYQSFSYSPPSSVDTRVDTLTGYGYHVHLNGTPPFRFRVRPTGPWEMALDSRAVRLLLRTGDAPLAFPLQSPIEYARRGTPLRADSATARASMTLERSTGELRARLAITSFNGMYTDDTLSSLWIDADLFLDVPR